MRITKKMLRDIRENIRKQLQYIFSMSREGQEDWYQDEMRSMPAEQIKKMRDDELHRRIVWCVLNKYIPDHLVE